MDEISEYLYRIKSEGKASPNGHAWHLFYEFLLEHQENEEDKPLPPLILAASYMSPQAKHGRLRWQLIWANEHGILENTFKYLDNLPEDKWMISTEEKWAEENRYWEDMED